MSNIQSALNLFPRRRHSNPVRTLPILFQQNGNELRGRVVLANHPHCRQPAILFDLLRGQIEHRIPRLFPLCDHTVRIHNHGTASRRFKR